MDESNTQYDNEWLTEQLRSPSPHEIGDPKPMELSQEADEWLNLQLRSPTPSPVAHQPGNNALFSFMLKYIGL